MTPMLKRIFEVSAMDSNSFSASSNSLLSYRARAATHVSISCGEVESVWFKGIRDLYQSSFALTTQLSKHNDPREMYLFK